MSAETLTQAIERAGLDYWDDKTVGENEWTSLQEAERMAAAVLAHFGVGSEEELTQRLAGPRAGEMHPVDEALYRVIVAERNAAWTTIDRIQAELTRLRAAGAAAVEEPR